MQTTSRIIEDRRHAWFARFSGDTVNGRLQQLRDRSCCKVSVAQAHDARSQGEELSVKLGITKVNEAEQVAARGSACQAGQTGGIADRHSSTRFIEQFDDGQALSQACDKITGGQFEGQFARHGRISHKFMECA